MTYNVFSGMLNPTQSINQTNNPLSFLLSVSIAELCRVQYCCSSSVHLSVCRAGIVLKRLN